VKATRLSLWEQNSEIREVFTLWLEALEARGVAPRTLESQQYQRLKRQKRKCFRGAVGSALLPPLQ
jgi:hypothetical protein